MATIKISDGLRHDQDLEKLEIRKSGVWNNIATIADIPSATTLSIINVNTTLQLGYVYLASGNITCTLPTAIGNIGKTITFKNIGTADITINTTLSQTIDGDTTAILNRRYTSVTFISDNNNWFII